MIERRFGGRARAAVGLIGTRIAAGPEGRELAERPDRSPPDWLVELDEYEYGEAGELWLGPYCELEDMLRARIVGSRSLGSAPMGSACAGERVARSCEGRRTRWPNPSR